MKKNVIFIMIALIVPCSSAHTESWRFAVTGDSYGFPWTYDENGVNTLILGELVQDMLARNVEVLLFPGDLVMGGTHSEDLESQLRTWRDTLEPLYDAGVKVYPVRGNHDAWDGNGWGGHTAWNNVFSGDYALPANGPAGEENLTFFARRNNALFVGLDLYINLHRVNQDWLDALFAASAAPHVFVFAHEPAFSVGHTDCLDDLPEERDAFWRSIAGAGGRTYFCTHDHFYNHARIDDGDGNPDNDIHQFVVGTAGSIHYPWDGLYDGDNGTMNPVLIRHVHGRYGYVLGEVDDLRVTLTFMARDSTDLAAVGRYDPNDTWTYTVEPAISIISPNGGERLAAGVGCAIKWKTNLFGRVETVLLEFSADGGATWSVIDTVVNNGIYMWDVNEGRQSDRCLIRITDFENVEIRDTSDAPFTVFECQEFLAGDLNGDCYVDMGDLAILAAEWLRCGNPFDSACWNN